VEVLAALCKAEDSPALQNIWRLLH